VFAVLFAPGTRNEILGSGGWAVTDYPDEPATEQQRQRILHGAARQTGGDSDTAMAGLRAATFGAAGLRPEMQVNQECRRPAVMAGKVAHEDVDHIMVEAQVRSHAHSLP